MSKKAVALWGGPLTPIHVGHLQLATTLAHLLHLQQVVLLPNNTPTHRQPPIDYTATMDENALLEDRRVTPRSIDDHELKRTTPSYSSTDTVQAPMQIRDTGTFSVYHAG